MPSLLDNTIDLVRRTYELAKPFGRKKLALIGGLSFTQALFQVLGVTSIFPFLALAAEPDRLRNSTVGQKFLSWLPPMEDAQLLAFAGFFAIGMLAIANMLNIAGDFFRNRYTQQYAHWLRLQLIRKIAARPYADFLQNNSGILLKKILGDVNNFSTGILLNLLDASTRIVTALLLIATLFLVHPRIALAASVGLLLFYGIFFQSFGKWRARASISLKKASRGAFVEMQQLLGGIKPVKVHRAESFFIERYRCHSQVQARLNAIIPVIGSTPRYLIEPFVFGGLVVAVLVLLGRNQDLSAILPNLGVMALAGYRLLPAIQLLYGQMTSLSTARHVLDEVYDEFLAVERSDALERGGAEGRFPQPKSLAWNREIRLENVSFRYEGAAKPVIQDFNLVIPKNSSVGIVGPTGCGKSTLVDLILGLHIPTGGHIFIDDTPLCPGNRRAWRAGIGYVPQDIFLLDSSVAANIAFGVPADQVDSQAVRHSAAAAQILDFIEKDLPDGFETVVGERGVRLSGGQRQRIGLARALYHQPDLLILDEATSALDHRTEAEVVRAINSLRGTITMIVIAHRLSTIEQCERTIELNRHSPVPNGA